MFSSSSGSVSLLPLGALLCLSLVACQNSAQRQLEGNWVGESVENLPLKQLAAATGWVRGTRLKFSKESLSIALPAEDARSAPYELVKSDSKGWTIRLKPVSQGAAKAGDAAMAPHEMKLSLHEDDRLAWDIGDGRRILLRRETR